MDSDRIGNFFCFTFFTLWFVCVISFPVLMLLGWMPGWVYATATFLGAGLLTLALLVIPAMIIMGGPK